MIQQQKNNERKNIKNLKSSPEFLMILKEELSNYISLEKHEMLEEKYFQKMEDNKILLDKLRKMEQTIKDCFLFMIEFYKNILLMPEEFEVDQKTFQVANFSFDLGTNKTKTSKPDYIKYSLLNFFLKNENQFIQFQLENKLFEIIEIYETKQNENLKNIDEKKKEDQNQNQTQKDFDIINELTKSPPLDKDNDKLGSHNKGTLRECLKNINTMIGQPKNSNIFLKSQSQNENNSKMSMNISKDQVNIFFFN